MYSFLSIKHKLLSLWLLIGLSLTLGYEVQVQLSSQHQIELIDVQTSTKASGVSYLPLAQQVKNINYTPLFTTFSFRNLLHIQNTTTIHTLAVQQTYVQNTLHTFIIDYLHKRSSLSDDTDVYYSQVILS